MPTPVDHYVTTTPARAGRIAQLALLTLGLAGVREVSISFVSQICYHTTVVGGECTDPGRQSLSPSRFQGKTGRRTSDILRYL